MGTVPDTDPLRGLDEFSLLPCGNVGLLLLDLPIFQEKLEYKQVKFPDFQVLALAHSLESTG